MPYEAEHALWAYDDERGSLKHSSFKMTEDAAGSQLPPEAIKVPGTEEMRWLPSNHIEEDLLELAPASVVSGCDVRPVVDLIVCGASSYNNVPACVPRWICSASGDGSAP